MAQQKGQASGESKVPIQLVDIKISTLSKMGTGSNELKIPKSYFLDLTYVRFSIEVIL